MTQAQSDKSSKDKKIAGSCLRVLELLKALAKSPLSPSELLKVLEEKSDKFYRKEVVTKYINTLKLLGLNILKEKDKYYIDKSIETMDFNEQELSLIKFLEKYTGTIQLETLQENVFDALQTIEKSFSEQTNELALSGTVRAYRPKKYTKKKSENVQKFEKYCKEALKLKLLYKSNEESEPQVFKVSPVKILYKKGKVVLIAYDCVNSVYKEFLLDFITECEQTPQKHAKDYPSAVTFMLKNRLARSYVLKEGEETLRWGKDFAVISNKKEDRDLLVRRLSRYFNQCEILYPKECREKMIEYVSDIEKLYEGQA